MNHLAFEVHRVSWPAYFAVMQLHDEDDVMDTSTL